MADAPAINQMRLNVSYMWVAQATLKERASYIPASRYSLIHQAVLRACDGRDGVADGVLDDPTGCGFDPGILRCGGLDAPSCLTAAQVDAARKIYAGPKNPRTLQPISAGLEPGSELFWAALAGGPAAHPIADTYFKYVVFKNPAWDFRAFDFDRDVDHADRLDNGLLAATEPDLTAFASRGGKLILTHGWNDQFIGPRNTISYYQSVVEKMGAATTADVVRLFMVPGMGHCGGGEGPNTFDSITAVERWVERGTRPDRMIATGRAPGKSDRSRPLCPYPQVARYQGTGSTDDAASFACVDPN